MARRLYPWGMLELVETALDSALAPEAGRTYLAVLEAWGRAHLCKGRACLDLGGVHFPVGWKGMDAVFREFPGAFFRVSLWPRTREDGTMDYRKTRIKSLVPLAAPPQARYAFYARGRLLAVDPAEGLLTLEVRPNPRGRLREPFALTLVASLELLHSLPKPGGGIRVEGEYRPASGRLVARAAHPVPLWDDPTP